MEGIVLYTCACDLILLKHAIHNFSALCYSKFNLSFTGHGPYCISHHGNTVSATLLVSLQHVPQTYSNSCEPALDGCRLQTSYIRGYLLPFCEVNSALILIDIYGCTEAK